MPQMRETAASAPDMDDDPPKGLLAELWQSGVYRLFPLLLLYITSIAVLLPFTPTIVTDFFASRSSATIIHCEEFKPGMAPMIGSWSDQYGRKPFLMAGFITAMLPVLVISAYVAFPDVVSLYLYYPASAINGSVSSVSISLAFVADLLGPRHRAACFGVIMATFSLGLLIGPVLGRFLTVQVAAAVCLSGIAASIAYVALLLPESLPVEARRQAHARATSKKQSIFSRWSSMRILLRSTLFKRLTLIIMITGIVSEGLQDLLLQYLQIKLAFNTKDQATLFMIFGVAGLLVQTLLLRLMLSCMGEVRLLILGMLASMTQQVALAFVNTKSLAFVAVALGTLGSVAFPAISSIKSNNVLDSEQGTVQGALYGARALAQGTGPFIFVGIFAAFTLPGSPLPYFPGACFLFGSVLMCGAMLIALTLEGQTGKAYMEEHQQNMPQEQPGSGACSNVESLAGEADSPQAMRPTLTPFADQPADERESLLGSRHNSRHASRQLSTGNPLQRHTSAHSSTHLR